MKADEFAACAPNAVLNQPPALENYNLYEFRNDLLGEQGIADGSLL